MTPAEQFAQYAAWSQRLDRAFRIPGTRWHFGYDALIGVIPGLGDFVGAVFGCYGVLVARRLGVPLVIQLRMLANVLVDALVGAVPIAGDLFDFAFKPHLRNLALLERWQKDPRRTRRNSLLMLVLVPASMLAILVVTVASALYAFTALLSWLLR